MSNEYRQTRYRPPSDATDILLIRHGESQPFRPGELFPLRDGQGDPPLHEDGHLQAERVAERLEGHTLAALYVTTLQRTRQTADPLISRIGLEPGVEPDLREYHVGIWEGGVHRMKAVEGDPLYLRALEKQDWGEIPGAETTAMFQARVRAGLMRIAAAHVGTQIAAFVHGGVIGAAMSIATGAEPMAFMGSANGSLSRLVVQGDRMRVLAFNDVSHLDGLV